MRRGNSAKQGPDFIHHDQWVARRRTRVRRWARLWTIIATCLILGAALSWIVRPYLRSRALAAAATALRTAQALHLVGTDARTHRRSFEVWIDGDRRSTERALDGFRYVRTGRRMAAIGQSVAYWSDPRLGPQDLTDQLASTLEKFAEWGHRNDVRPLGERAVGSMRQSGYVLEDRNTRTAFWVGADNLVRECSRAVRTASGWIDLWSATVSPVDRPQTSCWDLSTVPGDADFRAAALDSMARTETPLPYANDTINIKSFEMGRTGIVYLVAQMPATPKGPGRGFWQVRATDSLNDSYAETQVIRSVTTGDQRSPSLPPNLAIFALVPERPSAQFEPVTVTVRIAYVGPPGLPSDVPTTTEIRKHFDRPRPYLGPPYLYVDQPPDSVNRRLLTGQALATVGYAAIQLNSVSTHRSPNSDYLNGIFTQALDDVLVANADAIGDQQLDMLLRLTLPTLSDLQTDRFLDGETRAVPSGICEYLFPLASFTAGALGPNSGGTAPTRSGRTPAAIPRRGGRV